MKETLLIKNFTKHKISQKYLNKAAEKTLEIVDFKGPAEISLVITGDQKIKTLNKKYRKKDRVTDVLSFSALENKSGKKNKKIKFISPKEKAFLGEIFICYPQAARQSKFQNHSTKKEISILLIHGILHLLGYTHAKKPEMTKMKQKEKAIYSLCLNEK